MLQLASRWEEGSAVGWSQFNIRPEFELVGWEARREVGRMRRNMVQVTRYTEGGQGGDTSNWVYGRKISE